MRHPICRPTAGRENAVSMVGRGSVVMHGGAGGGKLTPLRCLNTGFTPTSILLPRASQGYTRRTKRFGTLSHTAMQFRKGDIVVILLSNLDTLRISVHQYSRKVPHTERELNPVISLFEAMQTVYNML